MLCNNLVGVVLLAVSTLVHASPLESRGNYNSNSNSFFSGFLDALEKKGLTTMRKVYSDFAQTEQGPELIKILKKQKLTVLVPTNEALGTDNPTFGGDDLFSLLNYVNIIGSIGTSKRKANPDHYTKRTTFGKQNTNQRRNNNNNDNQVQVVNRVKSNGETIYNVERTLSNATILSNSKYKNLKIASIDSILSLPRKTEEVLSQPLVGEAPEGFTKLLSGLYQTGLSDTVNNDQRITVFAPIDAAFDGLDGTSTDRLRALLENHVLKTRLYSPNFPTDSTVTAVSGEKLGFVYEGFTAFVTCGNQRAKVLRPDVITENGVVHVIDTLLTCD